MNKPIVTIGSKWKSLDPRDDGLIVKVLHLEVDRIQIQRFRKTWVRRDRFHSQYAPEKEPA